MLYINRKIGDSIIINNEIELTIIEVKGKTVKVGCVFPENASILRKELHDKIINANMVAASAMTNQESLEILKNTTLKKMEK